MLKITSVQAPNADPFCLELTSYFARRLELKAEYVTTIPWQEREQMIDSGEVHVSWLCGLPYVWKADRPDPSVELLAAAVMEGRRYMHLPVYFSDIVVRSDSRFHSFEDLRGSTWAYNEPNSHSGYNVVRYHLATLGELYGYFGTVLESGAHQSSLEWILDGKVDASAIDSTVLETELAADATLQDRLRVVEILGPSPIPPWVVSKNLPATLKESIREAILSMHLDEEGREILRDARIRQFVAVKNLDYDPIREMEHMAAWVEKL